MVDALPTPDRRKYGSKLNQPPEEFEIELVYFLKDMVISDDRFERKQLLSLPLGAAFIVLMVKIQWLVLILFLKFHIAHHSHNSHL